MKNELKILMLEDVPEDAELIERELHKDIVSFVSYKTDNKQDFLKGLKEFKPDVILSDFSLPTFNGLEALELVKKIAPETPFIMVTGSINEETAVLCMKQGAWDYVIKENLTRLGYAVINAIKLKEENDKIKLAENELRKLSVAINQSPSTIVITDKNGIIEYVNPFFSKLTGYTKNEAIGHNPKILKSGKTPDETYKKLWDTILSGNIWEGEFINKKKDGDYYWESAIITPVKNDDNEITNFIAIKHDITKKKKDEQIQKVLYNISNAAITTDNLNKLISFIQKELGNIIDTSNFFVALYNKETDTISLPFHIDEKDKFTDAPAGKTLTKYVIETKKPLLANIAVKNRFVKEGRLEIKGSLSKIWLGVPLKKDDEVMGVLAVQSYTDEKAYTKSDMEMLEFVSDQISITIDRKKAEQDIKNALERATESDRLKSTFLATMSHELRTPLNAIIGFSGLINKDTSAESIISYAKTIKSSGEDLLSIVEDLFDITLIEAGMSNVKNTQINLNVLLKEILKIIKIEQYKTNKDNLELDYIIPLENGNIIINTDAVKLKQILINVLKNALKFTHEGHVNYGYNIETIKDKPIIKFFINDTGIGIPQDKHKLIFDVFRQSDDSHTRLYGGTGIGLSIAKKLTELLGGKIWLESEEGKGSTFYFTIPYNTPKNTDKLKDHDTKTVLDNRFKNKTILIVEDDVVSYKFLKIALELYSADIIWAKDGAESVEFCKANANIDLVLMDLNMHGMDGYVATKKIKEFLPDLPIIAQTAYAIAGDREKALAAGCDNYISKPIDLDTLMKILKKWI